MWLEGSKDKKHEAANIFNKSAISNQEPQTNYKLKAWLASTILKN